MKEKNIVTVVPARSGSCGLPKKNILDLDGKPMLAHSIEPALACPLVQDVYVNSDLDEYIDIGKAYGAKPYKRPPHLASNTATMVSVLAQFLDNMEKGGKYYDAALVLYPTYPFRTPEQIEDCIRFYLRHSDCSSAIALKKPETHPYLYAKLDGDSRVSTFVPFDVNRYYRRQDYPTCYQFTAWSVIVSVNDIDKLNAQMFNENTIGYVLPDDAITLDIDTIEDYKYAQFLVSCNNSQSG